MIQVLVIVGLAAFLTAIALLLSRWLGLARGRAEEAAARSAVQSAAVDQRGFAYRAGLVRSTATIRNLQGDCLISRHMRGVSANPNFTMTVLRGSVSTSGAISGSPRLVEVAGLAPERVGFTGTTKENAGWFEFSFSPALTPADPPFQFTIDSDFTAGFLMMRAAVVQKYQNDAFNEEYYGVRVDIPVDAVEIEVQFPERFDAEVSAAALRGSTEIKVAEETARVAKQLVRKGSVATLRVEEPVLSYLYVIHWMPAA